ncbi:acyclic terpene utilization AtuA family protein [Kutzneria chonburiensis]|uniref:acyclic terpene utilization AtuA family protein n=1 Tax=Kutzneria chonburiensis TaxID=1483604 RepID=UPI00236196B7|nr:acyclic terpene utilization AtuA family protein [Kutzneria chonburiensis]
MARPIRIANFAGAIGDRFSAFEEAVRGEPVDVVMGDAMAEITMSMIVAGFVDNADARRGFYWEPFLRQLRPQLATVAERKIKVVTNAGIYHPAGLAEAIRQDIADQGLDLSVAYVTGDDLTDTAKDLVAQGQLAHLETGAAPTVDPDDFLAANAYLGGWGIKTALDEGTDIVITGRVADASLVTGPAAWWHGWARDDLDRIAGATAAAHVIECGPQATGGNFAGFTSIADNTRPGFPIAEVADDGSFVITKRAADGGAVTVDTVTAQLMYEIQGPRYLNPDVTWHTDAIELTQQGPDRVLVTGAKGSAASETTKVGINFQRGYRGAMWLFPTGLDVDAKVDMLKAQAEQVRQDRPVDELHFFVCGRPAADPRDQWQATVATQVVVAAPTQRAVTAFLAQLGSYALSSIPGFYVDMNQGWSTNAQPRIDYWPGLIRQADLAHQVHLPDGRVLDIAPLRSWRRSPASLRAPAPCRLRRSNQP